MHQTSHAVVLEAASLCRVVGDEAKTSNNLKPKPRIIRNRIKVLMLELEPVLRALQEDLASLVPNALMEFLRLEGSVQGLARTTTRPALIT